MQINSINNNQNFGMALRIDPRAAEALQGKSENYLLKLSKLGEKIKDYQYVDIFIKEDVTPVVKFKNAGNAYSNIRMEDKPALNSFATITATNESTASTSTFGKAGDTVSDVFNLSSTWEVERLRKALNDPKSDSLDKAEAFAETIENRGRRKAVEAAQKAAEEAVQKDKVTELMKNFGEFVSI